MDSYKVRVRQPVVNYSGLVVVNFCCVEQTARGRGARTRWKLIRIGGGYVSYYIIERRRYSLRDG
jgi:hypothetical protein